MLATCGGVLRSFAQVLGFPALRFSRPQCFSWFHGSSQLRTDVACVVLRHSPPEKRCHHQPHIRKKERLQRLGTARSWQRRVDSHTRCNLDHAGLKLLMIVSWKRTTKRGHVNFGKAVCLDAFDGKDAGGFRTWRINVSNYLSNDDGDITEELLDWAGTHKEKSTMNDFDTKAAGEGWDDGQGHAKFSKISYGSCWLTHSTTSIRQCRTETQLTLANTWSCSRSSSPKAESPHHCHGSIPFLTEAAWRCLDARILTRTAAHCEMDSQVSWPRGAAHVGLSRSGLSRCVPVRSRVHQSKIDSTPTDGSHRLFSIMPPLEAFQGHCTDGVVASGCEVLDREVFAELPEDTFGRDVAAQLKKSWYGLQDASRIWQGWLHGADRRARLLLWQ